MYFFMMMKQPVWCNVQKKGKDLWVLDRGDGETQ